MCCCKKCCIVPRCALHWFTFRPSNIFHECYDWHDNACCWTTAIDGMNSMYGISNVYNICVRAGGTSRAFMCFISRCACASVSYVVLGCR